MSRLDETLREIDRVNAQDPRRPMAGGEEQPREWLFARRVDDWIMRLHPLASESVRLAARAHTLRRWEVPRDRYPMDTAGYHAWREATARHSADAAAALLAPLGWPPETVDRVRRLITRELFGRDADAQLLEDADCLAFLELKLVEYLERWDDRKLGRILKGTWAKMSAPARALARQLPLDPRAGHLLNID